MVEIVIPIYKNVPDNDDLISLKQVVEVLENHKITFVHPKSLNIKEYQRFSTRFLAFDDYFFDGIYGYNQLMLNEDFYKSFNEKYILIYQTDCFVFKDNLKDWCEKDLDYIGAPWIRSSENLPFFKILWDKGICKLKSFINYKDNGKWQKDKSLLYNEVGNGGLSLRKCDKFIEILQKLPQVKEVYLDKKNSGQFYAEDVFFSIEPKRNGIEFSKPNYKQACLFAIENKQEKALDFNNGVLPFGCHRWNKERNFWRKYFLNFGIEI